MTFVETLESTSLAAMGNEMHRFAAELYPICRSITGDGIRQTLNAIGKRVPLRFTEVPSGTKVFDWTVPNEWNIRDAYIKDANGRKVVDFAESSLHVLNYSTPIRATLPLAELKQHLFSLPEHPDWIPYRTSYYKETWGFCMRHRDLVALQDGTYEVCIDAELKPGQLTYAECFIPGRSTDEVLISAHACHPSLADDNLSGLAIATALAELVSRQENRLSYRFLFIPGTIGAITWLARNRDQTRQVAHGLVLACVGDPGKFHYKRSRRGDAEIDQAARHVLRYAAAGAEIQDFVPYGHDERQYCSPGFNLPVGCLMRSVWETFPEYHTSADNLDFVRPGALAESLRVCAAILDVVEHNHRFRNLNPYCEPQLGKRDLYRSTGGESIGVDIPTMLWVLNLSDGEQTLLDIAERSNIPFASILRSAKLLEQAGLLEDVEAMPSSTTARLATAGPSR